MLALAAVVDVWIGLEEGHLADVILYGLQYNVSMAALAGPRRPGLVDCRDNRHEPGRFSLRLYRVQGVARMHAVGQ